MSISGVFKGCVFFFSIFELLSSVGKFQFEILNLLLSAVSSMKWFCMF